jgi:hypothetical protein
MSVVIVVSKALTFVHVPYFSHYRTAKEASFSRQATGLSAAKGCAGSHERLAVIRDDFYRGLYGLLRLSVLIGVSCQP